MGKATSQEKKNKQITIKYAREKLGKKAEEMTDKQIQDLLNTLRSLCNKAIDSVIPKDSYEN